MREIQHIEVTLFTCLPNSWQSILTPAVTGVNRLGIYSAYCHVKKNNMYYNVLGGGYLS